MGPTPTTTPPGLPPACAWWERPIRSRLWHAVEEKLKCDLTFLVGPKEESISAHKLILSLSSPVLQQMVDNALDGIIRLPSVSAYIFQWLIKFIYTDETPFFEISEFLEVAESFGFSHLKGFMLDSLRNTGITPENVIFTLQVAECGKDVQLADKCRDFMKTNADVLLSSEVFFHLPYQELCWFLSLDNMEVQDELTVFRGLLSWAKKRSSSASTLPSLLEKARFLIRYNQIPYDIMMAEVQNSGALTTQDFLTVMKTYIVPDFNPLELSFKERKYIKNKYVKEEPQEPSSRASKRAVSKEAESQPPPKKVVTATVSRDPRVRVPAATSSDPVEVCFFSEEATVPTQMLQAFAPPSPVTNNYHNQPNMSIIPDQFFLSNCTIDFSHLISQVSRNQTFLRTITLKNVTITYFSNISGSVPELRRVLTPNLASFHFIQDAAQPFPFPFLTIHNPSFLGPLTLKDFLFFEKKPDDPWSFSSLPSLGVEILISSGGVKFLEISSNQSKLVLSRPVPEEADLLLEDLPQDLKTLSLSYTGIQNPLSLPFWIETLILFGVEVKGITLTRFLSRFSNLKTLSVWEIPKSAKAKDCFSALKFTQDFRMCKKALQSLSLTRFKIIGPRKKKQIVIEQEKIMKEPFSAVKSVYLFACIWYHAFPLHFPKLFPNLRQLGIRSLRRCLPSPAFILDLLKNLKSLELLAISVYCEKKKKKKKKARLFANLDTTEEGRKLQSLLVESGVTVQGYTVEGFVIMKNEDGEWKAFGPEVLEQLHFDALGTKEFFAGPNLLNFIDIE